MTKTFDELPIVIRILAIIFFGWVLSGVYRILKFLETKDFVTLVAGVLALATGFGNLIFEVVDLITTVIYGKITFLAK